MTNLQTSGMILFHGSESFVEPGLADHVKPLVHPPQLGDVVILQE